MDSEDRKVVVSGVAMMLIGFIGVLSCAATAGLAWRLFTLIGGV